VGNNNNKIIVKIIINVSGGMILWKYLKKCCLIYVIHYLLSFDWVHLDSGVLTIIKMPGSLYTMGYSWTKPAHLAASI